MASEEHSFQERFTFVKQIGQGGYSTIWIGNDAVTGKRLVFKEISKTTTTRIEFKRELWISKYLSKHPNIINTHNAYETNTSYFAVQDYAFGGDLFDAIKQNVGLIEFTAKLYLGQICRAVEFMHSNNLVHRDIKPENVVADKLGSIVQLIDFGLTLRAGTHIEVVSGTISYLAPEICYPPTTAGLIVDPSCDVWSVGILLFCMLTGGYPWEQATLNNSNYYKFVQWQCGISTVPPNVWRYFSPDLLTLFKKMLAMESADRCTIVEVYKYLNCSWFSN